MAAQVLSEKLKALRTDAHLSQKDLAKFLGLSGRQVRRYESGTVLPGPRTIRAYAKTFGLNTVDLLDQRFECGSKALFAKLKPYVESHLTALSKQIYSTGQVILKLKQQAGGTPWHSAKIEELEDDLEGQLLYYRKAVSDWETAHYM